MPPPHPSIAETLARLTMQQGWVCTHCRSLNHAREKRCYRCRVPRSKGELTEATAGLTQATARESVTVLTQATRLGARYRPSWPLALLVIPTILAATAIDISQTHAMEGLIRLDGWLVDDPVRFEAYTRGASAQFAAYLLSIVTWSIWIAVVVSNVPALVAAWPSRGPFGAFFAPFVPIACFRRPMSVVREVVVLIDDRAIGAGLIVTAWWGAWLAAYVVPGIAQLTGGFAGPGATRLQVAVAALELRLVFLVPAALLAIAVVVVVEGLQHRALRRRAMVLMAVDGSSA